MTEISGEAQGGHFRQTTLRIQPRGRGEHDTAAYPCTLHKMAALHGGPSSVTSRPTTPSLPPLHLSDHLAPTHNVPLTCMISFRAHLTLFDMTLSGPLVLLLSVWHNDKESACRYRRHKKCGFDPRVRKISWRRKWKPTPVFFPGESPWTEEPGGLQSKGSQRVRYLSD